MYVVALLARLHCGADALRPHQQAKDYPKQLSLIEEQLMELPTLQYANRSS
jgi:hypothetical protein